MHNVRNRTRARRRGLLTLVVGLVVLGIGAPADAQEAPPAVIGDSLTVGAAPFLPATWSVDGRNGRMLEEATPAIATAANRARRCIVVALGSNDVSHDHTEARMRRDLREAGALLRDRSCVLWTTVKVLGVGYYGPGWRRFALQWNRLVRREVEGDVLDWDAEAVVHPEYFLGDGLHMTRAGRAAYARFIRRGVREHLAG
jgi:hypothetical protein